MSRSTIIAVCCYQGDRHQVLNQMRVHCRSGHSVIILSPDDSPVLIPGFINLHAGHAAYIGDKSLTRQIKYFEALLKFDHQFFLLHDSDSMMLSKEIPDRLYLESSEVLWSNEVREPRPHDSPYPKLAFQPPYFLNRDSMRRMVEVSNKIPVHPITPYVDWYMNALSSEAGLKHRAFTELEHPSRCPTPFSGSDPWLRLEYRIKYMGTNFVHPIKTPREADLCLNARTFYEKS